MHELRRAAHRQSARPQAVQSSPAVSIAAEADFDFGSDEYAALFERSQASAFQHPLWLQALYARVAPARGAKPLVITGRAPETGRLAMVLPLLRRRACGFTTISYADLGLSDYAVPVCTPDDWARIAGDPGSARRLRRALGRFDLLRIPKLRPDGPDLSSLIGAGCRLGPHATAYAVPLTAPYPQWRAARMPASVRKEMDKKRRRLERHADVTFECLRDPAAITAALRKLHSFRRPRFEARKEPDVLDDPAVFDFYEEVGISGAAIGFSRTYTINIGSRVVAVVFGTHHRGQFLVLLSAFDPDFAKLSLGYLLFENVVMDCIDRGDTTFDLTIGDEAYKTSFGTEPTRLSVLTRSGSVAGWAADRFLASPSSRHAVRWLRSAFR